MDIRTLATFLSKSDNKEDGIIKHITSFLLGKLKALNFATFKP
jgi:hypothetical protein